jgi:hypothetical protein
LEWLVDLGYLTKEEVARNTFEYEVTSDARSLLEVLDQTFGDEDWADEASLVAWKSHASWRQLRSEMATDDRDSAIAAAYRIMRRRIGPAPLREVAFITGILCGDLRTYREAVDTVVKFAQETDGASLSGGRYSRSPANIYVPNSALPEGG